jgi:hypothetical protein
MLLHDDDVENISELLVKCLGFGEIIIEDANFARFETKLLKHPVALWNNFAKFMSTAETSLGLRSRATSRLQYSPQNPQSKYLDIIGTNSLFVVFREEETMEFVGGAELTMEVPTGELPSNFRGIFGLKEPNIVDCRPYLCNVVCADKVRRLGLGRRLVAICKDIALTQWG